MYNYAKCRAPGPRARGANLKRKREGIFSLSTGLFILECDCNLLEDYEADFLAIDVARSERAIFDVSNSHFLFLSFVLSVIIILHYHPFVNTLFYFLHFAQFWDSNSQNLCATFLLTNC